MMCENAYFRLTLLAYTHFWLTFELEKIEMMEIVVFSKYLRAHSMFALLLNTEMRNINKCNQSIFFKNDIM